MSKTVLNQLRKKVETEGRAKFAYLLGYATCDSIHKWLERGTIPKRRVSEVKELLKDEHNFRKIRGR